MSLTVKTRHSEGKPPPFFILKGEVAFNKSVTFVGILIPKGINNFNTVPNMK
jgi:hypothetical protein